MSFRSTLNKLNDELKSKVPNLNCGGCGRFCWYFYLYSLIKRSKLPTIYEFTNNNTHHIMCKLDNLYFDGYENGTKIGNIDEFKVNKLNILQLTYKIFMSDWNKKYELRFNSVVKNIIKKHL